MEERCDQIMDCEDKSDENSCNLIVFEENYNKKVPPFTIIKKDHVLIPARVNVSTHLKNVLAISEFSHTIDLKLGITLEWYENRVLYHNLKIKEALNILSDVEVKYSTSYILYTCLHNNKLRLKVFGSPTLFLKTLTQTKQSHWRLKL